MEARGYALIPEICETKDCSIGSEEAMHKFLQFGKLKTAALEARGYALIPAIWETKDCSIGSERLCGTLLWTKNKRSYL